MDTILHHIPLDLIEMIICQNKEDRNLNTYYQITQFINKLDSVYIWKRIFEKFTIRDGSTPIYSMKKPNFSSTSKHHYLYDCKPKAISEATVFFNIDFCRNEISLLPSSFKNNDKIQSRYQLPYCITISDRCFTNIPLLDTQSPLHVSIIKTKYIYIFHNLRIKLNGARLSYSMNAETYLKWSIFSFI